MTIKISELGNITVVQGNTFVPAVSNITGVLTTVKSTVDQLKTFIVANAEANILAANAATIFANTVMKGYVDGQITAANAGVTAANLGIVGYVNLANTIQSAQIASANLGIIGYVDNSVSTANIAMKGYVDSVASQSIYGNANVAAYLHTNNYNPYSNVNVTVFTNLSTYAYNANVTAANIGVVGYIDNAVSIANIGMKGYVDSVANQSIYGNANVASYLITNGYVNTNSAYANSNVKSYLTGGFDGNIIPSANVTYSLGSATNQWKDLWVGNSTIYIGGVPISTDQGNVNVDSITVPDLWAGNIYLGSTGYMSGLIFDNGTTISGSSAQLGNIFVGSRDANLKLRSNVRIGTGTECWSVTTLVPGVSQDDHPSLIVLSNTNSISPTTGAVVISGGVGIAGNVSIGGNLFTSGSYAPTLANSAGTAGQIVWDSNYVYICIATNTWKRANISTW